MSKTSPQQSKQTSASALGSRSVTLPGPTPMSKERRLAIQLLSQCEGVTINKYAEGKPVAAASLRRIDRAIRQCEAVSAVLGKSTDGLTKDERVAQAIAKIVGGGA